MLKRIASPWVLGVSVLTLFSAFLYWVDRIPLPTVEAQSGTAPFTVTVTLPASNLTQYIPPCVSVSTGCIRGANQVADTVQYFYALQHDRTVRNCGITLDGSSDNVNWQTVAASGNAAGNQNGTFQANGYFYYKRIRLLPCTNSAVTVTYTGYSASVPINNQSFPSISTTATTPVTVGTEWYTPSAMTGLQCSNPDPSNAAWLQVFWQPNQPILGGSLFFNIMIPANSTYNYSGPPISVIQQTGSPGYYWIGAATTPGNSGNVLSFAASPTAGGAAYVQADVGALLTLACGAQVEILQVNGGAGTGGVTQIATVPSSGGSGCHTGVGQATTGGTGAGATLSVTATAGQTPVSTPILCTIEVNGSGPYYPQNPLSP